MIFLLLFTFFLYISSIFKLLQSFCKARPTLLCRILSVMAQPNPAFTPHDFVPSNPQTPKHVLQG